MSLLDSEKMSSGQSVRHAGLPLMQNGDRLDQRTFHRLYERMPKGVKAELIDGIVFMASTLTVWHALPHGMMIFWLNSYAAKTPGVAAYDNATDILSETDEPQPDGSLTIIGRQTRINEDGYLVGPPELAIEVAASSVGYDLNNKKSLYERHGVGEYLVFAVAEWRAVWFCRRDNRFVEIEADSDGINRSRMFPGLWLDAAALLRGDGERVQQVVNSGLNNPEHAAFAASLQPKK